MSHADSLNTYSSLRARRHLTKRLPGRRFSYGVTTYVHAAGTGTAGPRTTTRTGRLGPTLHWPTGTNRNTPKAEAKRPAKSKMLVLVRVSRNACRLSPTSSQMAKTPKMTAPLGAPSQER